MKKLETIDLERLSLQDYRESEKLPIVVVADNIRSMNNVGSILRTADTFRLQGVFLCGITARPPHPDIHKTALGAEESVDWEYSPDTLSAVRQLREEGFQILALEQATESISLEQFIPTSNTPYALVIGNEVHGVDQRVLDWSDACLEIPQLGIKHSLNVSVACGIALWQLVSPLIKNLK